MKKTFLLLTAIILFGCTGETKKNEVSVIIDLTGSNAFTLQAINPDGVLRAMQFEYYKSSENVYQQGYITESFVGDKKRLHLDAEPNFLVGNSYDREESIASFKQQITQSLLEAKNDSLGRGASSVYLPIVKELKRLSGVDATQKTLIIYSDLIENSDWFSLLDKQNADKLLRDPKEIEKIFTNEMRLPDDLEGITIYLIHQPVMSTETIYRKLSALYKNMLEKRGAITHIEGNL